MVKVSMPAWRRRQAMPMPPKPEPMMATRGVVVPAATRPFPNRSMAAERTDLDRPVKRVRSLGLRRVGPLPHLEVGLGAVGHVGDDLRAGDLAQVLDPV